MTEAIIKAYALEAQRDKARIAELEAALAAPAPEPVAKPQWIKCSERMPPPGTAVLALVSGHVCEAELRWDTPGYEDTYEAFLYWDCPHDDGQSWEHSEVTHWMPLPALPKEES